MASSNCTIVHLTYLTLTRRRSRCAGTDGSKHRPPPPQPLYAPHRCPSFYLIVISVTVLQAPQAGSQLSLVATSQMTTPGPQDDNLPLISEVRATAPVCHHIVVMTQDMVLEQICREGFSLFMDSEEPEDFLDIVVEVFDEVWTSYTQQQNALPPHRRKLPEGGEFTLLRTLRVSVADHTRDLDYTRDQLIGLVCSKILNQRLVSQ